MLLPALCLPPEAERLAGGGSLSDVATCVKKLNSQVNTYSLLYCSQQPFVMSAVAYLHFANEDVELIAQVFRAKWWWA